MMSSRTHEVWEWSKQSMQMRSQPTTNLCLAPRLEPYFLYNTPLLYEIIDSRQLVPGMSAEFYPKNGDVTRYRIFCELERDFTKS